MRNLLNFLAANRGRGAGFCSLAKGDVLTLDVYDVIVSSDADADWMGGVSAERFAREVRGFRGGEVHVRLNSPGGDVFGGVAMANALRETAARVIVHVDGYAASAASLLVAAADEAVIAPGGMVMIHNAWTIALGNADDFMATAELLEKIDGEIAEAYFAKAGGDKEKWRALMAAETWFTGAEAVEAGLVDRVAERAQKAPQNFDLSAFAHAPALPVQEVATPEPAIDKTELERVARARARAVLLRAA